jgi:hypothetical protein
MTFDNSKSIIKFRIRLFVVTTVVLAYLILTYMAEIIKFPVLGMSETYWTLILTVIWLIIAITPMVLNYQFIYFSDDSDKLVIRYFNAGIFGGKKNSVEIDKRTFSGYTTETRFFGFILSLTLLQRFNEGIAKYPPIYISALSSKERSQLFRILNSYSAD